MSDPNELNADARALLQMTRGAGEPDAASLARVRNSVLRTVAAGSVAVGAAVGASKVAVSAPPAIGATATSTSFGAVVAKCVAVVAVVGATAAAIHAYAPDLSTPAPPTVSTTVPTSTTVIATIPPLASGESDETLPGVPTTTPAPARAIAPPDRSAGRPRPTPRAIRENVPVEAPSSPPLPSAPSLAGDLTRLREAHLALSNGQPERALEATGGVADTSPFVDERDGIRVLARCAMAKRAGGETSAKVARLEGERFLSSHPGAAIGERVRADCDVR